MELKIKERIVEIMERTIAPISAAKNESMVKPDTNREVIQSISPLITKVKIPIVRILIGRVMSSIIGRIIILTSPSMRAAHNADEKE